MLISLIFNITANSPTLAGRGAAPVERRDKCFFLVIKAATIERNHYYSFITIGTRISHG